ncbi:MAG: hypothetical protein HKN47_20860 [Pirellulaceae bacterium]|nr:hypothetical protein [Pirellulaceae bacterium]
MYLLPACLIVLGVLAYVAIPPDVRAMLAENCRDRRGRWKPKYFVRELRAVASFYSRLVFLAAILGIVLMFGLVMVDSYVIPIGIAQSALESVDPDPNVWKENLTTGSDNAKKEFVQWHLASGGSKADAVAISRFLWRTFSVATVASFLLLVTGLRLTSKSYNTAFQDLVQGATDRDLRRIRQRYLHRSGKRHHDQSSNRHASRNSHESPSP